MHPKSYYEEEIRRRRLEGDQGDGVSLAELEAEFAKYFGNDPPSSSENRTKNIDPEPGASGGGVLPPKLEPYSDQTEEIPEAIREQTPYYAIDGRPYDEFFGAIEGGMRGASRHGKLGVDKYGKVYAREGMSDVDQRLVELKWQYDKFPEDRDRIAAHAARLRAQHEGEYTVTEDMPLSHFQLLESDFLKELEKGPPKLEAPPVPEEEIRAVFDEEFSDEPQFRNTYGPEFRNAPQWLKILSEKEDPVVLEGLAESERILKEIRGEYIDPEYPAGFTTTFDRSSPRQDAVKELQEKQNGPEFLRGLDFLISLASIFALKKGDNPSVFTTSFRANQVGTIMQGLVEDAIESNGKPGLATTLYQSLYPYVFPNDIPKARGKLALFDNKRHYQNLVSASSKTVFTDRLKKKIDEIERDMPQKYDDPEQDKKYREAVLEPLRYALLVNEHSDEIFDQLNRDFERIDHSYRKTY